MEKEKCNLAKIAESINDEYGEFLLLLSDLDRYSYCFSDQFKESFNKELAKNKKFIEDNYKSVENTSGLAMPTITTKNFVHVDDIDWIPEDSETKDIEVV
jgi:hypothetical protein